MYRPELMLIASRPTSRGSSSSPDSVADTPCTSCRYWGKNARAPNIAMPLTNAMMLETVKIWIRNSPSGRIGSGAIASRNAKPTSISAPSVNNPMTCHDPHG
jgi:hypothetical protein